MHLVTLSSLVETFPEIAGRHRLAGPSLAERGIALLPESKPQPKPAAVRQPAAVPQPKAQPDQAAAAQVNPVEMVPQPELDKLYVEIEEASAHNAKLMAELSDAGTGLNKLLDEIQYREQTNTTSKAILLPDEPSEDNLSKIQRWHDLDSEQKQLEDKRKRGQYLSWGVTATLCTILLVAIFSKGKGAIMAASGPDAAAAMPAPDPERKDPSTLTAQQDAELSNHMADGEALSLWDADLRAGEAVEPNGLLSYEEALGAPPALALPTPQVKSVPEALVMPDIASEEKEDEATELIPLVPEPVPALNVPTATTIPAGQELSALVLSGDPACMFAKLTAPGQELRDVLGPCIGPWNKAAGAVAGGFRHSGDRYCRHHLIVAKDLGGSVDRARNVANYAINEGLLPPLVRLRVEHGAADLLQKRVGKWVESGFEAGLSGQHELIRGQDDDHWSLHSWVRLQTEPGSQAELRHFSMELQLAADKGRDKWISFEWTEGR